MSVGFGVVGSHFLVEGDGKGRSRIRYPLRVLSAGLDELVLIPGRHSAWPLVGTHPILVGRCPISGREVSCLWSDSIIAFVG